MSNEPLACRAHRLPSVNKLTSLLPAYVSGLQIGTSSFPVCALTRSGRFCKGKLDLYLQWEMLSASQQDDCVTCSSLIAAQSGSLIMMCSHAGLLKWTIEETARLPITSLHRKASPIDKTLMRFKIHHSKGQKANSCFKLCTSLRNCCHIIATICKHLKKPN